MECYPEPSMNKNTPPTQYIIISLHPDHTKCFTILVRTILSSHKQNHSALHVSFQTLSQNANMTDRWPVTHASGTLLADLACPAIAHHTGHVQPTSYTRRRKWECVTGTAKEASPRTQQHRRPFVLRLRLKRVTQESDDVLEVNLFGGWDLKRNTLLLLLSHLSG